MRKRNSFITFNVIKTESQLSSARILNLHLCPWLFTNITWLLAATVISLYRLKCEQICFFFFFNLVKKRLDYFFKRNFTIHKGKTKPKNPQRREINWQLKAFLGWEKALLLFFNSTLSGEPWPKPHLFGQPALDTLLSFQIYSSFQMGARRDVGENLITSFPWGNVH